MQECCSLYRELYYGHITVTACVSLKIHEYERLHPPVNNNNLISHCLNQLNKQKRYNNIAMVPVTFIPYKWMLLLTHSATSYENHVFDIHTKPNCV